MRLIDADAFKEYITEACEDLAPLFNDNGKVARLVTENFCKDIDEQPTIHPEPHWISCNERLPEKPNKTYLVTLDYGEQGRAIGQVFYHFEPIGWADSAVIAWMPLPEPYKGVTE